MDPQTVDLDFKVPIEFVREFKLDPRIIVKHPWIIGIPAPEGFVRPELLAKVREAGFEMMLVPKSVLR